MPVTTIPHPNSSSSASTSISTSATPSTKPVFFWKPNDGHGYLSQWYWSKFTVDNETYAQAEMWMMVQKARCFGDWDDRSGDLMQRFGMNVSASFNRQNERKERKKEEIAE
jgi:predicted NAD-dependent protein-ADP-ribosyltransferase YbiA (DUF1768 family)